MVAALLLGAAGAAASSLESCPVERLELAVERFAENPLIDPKSDPSIGSNIQGPSLIEVPEWVESPLGRYYLYFADHKGGYIRMAYADALQGPWTVHVPGTLQLGESHFLTEPAKIPQGILPSEGASTGLTGFADEEREGVMSAIENARAPHIASPDVHVRQDRREIVMYFHGLEGFRQQVTRVATSRDGIRFEARPEILGNPYFRVFPWNERWYALAMPGQLSRSADGLSGFERGPLLFGPGMRHSAVLQRGERLFVFWTRAGDAPERILLSVIDRAGDWSAWRESEPIEVLRPDHPWEGADLPIEPSVRGAIGVRVNQLRDPAIFETGGKTYLFYAVAGESGIAGAEIELRCRS